MDILSEGFYLDKIYTQTVTGIYDKTAKITNFVDTKILANYKPVLISAKIGVKIAAFIEKYIMNGTVKLITDLAKGLSKLDLIAQNGNIQRYNVYAFIIITTILTCLIIGYVSIYMGG